MTSPTVKLSSGYFMPVVGLGTFDDFKSDRCEEAVAIAIEAGYRHIDTAWVYQCEAAVGQGIARKIKDGTVKREELFVVSKLWNTCHTRAEAAIQETLTDMGLDYLDLYLIHWPIAFKPVGKPKTAEELVNGSFLIDRDLVDTWKDLEKLVDQGLVHSIGLSNFNQDQVNRILNIPDLKYKPVCNQIEVHPFFTNEALVEFCKSKDIVPVGFAPLGRAGVDYGLTPVRNVTEEILIKNLAEKYNKNPGQIVLRWATQKGRQVILPKSSNPERIKGNIQLFDFEMTSNEIAAISSLNTNYRICTFPMWKEIATFPFIDVKARYGIV